MLFLALVLRVPAETKEAAGEQAESCRKEGTKNQEIKIQFAPAIGPLVTTVKTT
jgi:hypothetical protein